MLDNLAEFKRNADVFTATDIYTPKQLEFMRIWQEGRLERLNILEGSVRSGKTWISLVLWAFWVSQQYPTAEFLMVGKTLGTLRRNCLNVLTNLVGTKNFKYSIGKKEGKLFGRTVYLEGAHDSRSEGNIRGMTLHGAYLDEITLLDEDFFSMLLSRLSTKGAKLIGTTNPDSPKHWLYEKYIARPDTSEEISLLTKKFLIDDNTFLPEEYIRNIKAEYTGVFYERFILGKWVVAEGLIYPEAALGHYSIDPADSEPTGRIYISVDYGTMNPFAAGVYHEQKNGAWWRLEQFYYDGRKSQAPKTDSDYADEIEKLIGNRAILGIIVDPSASSFITELRRRNKWAVRPADNAVVDGIRNTAKAFQQGKLRISKTAKEAHDEFSTYRWDTKADKDMPVQENDHICDEIRYFVNTIINREGGGKMYD